MTPPTLLEALSHLLMHWRKPLLVLFALFTALMLYAALQTHIDAGFAKRLPKNHEYIQTFLEYEREFGGANRVLIAFSVPDGDIFDETFFNLLRQATDEAYYIPGVDRARVQSIFTPNVRFIEVVEDGFAGGNVIPADFTPNANNFVIVRENILKSGHHGRLVANDFSAAIISVQLQEINPDTGERLDYLTVSAHLEEVFREAYEERGEAIGLEVHIIGFAPVMGAIAEGTREVILFFFISLLLTTLLVYRYSQSGRLTVMAITTSLVAVIWQMGMLNVLGYGIDPMSILVPFLIFAIAVSHGVQMVRSFRAEFLNGKPPVEAAAASFRTLLVPGGTALVTDTIGFVTILLIDIAMIQELAIAASLGVGMVILTNLFVLPLLLSFVRLRPSMRERIQERHRRFNPIWRQISKVSQTGPSLTVMAIALGLFALGYSQAARVKIGDQGEGVPELRASSTYNQDSFFITDKFSIGVDLISVIAETVPDGVISHDIMTHLDRFAWHMENVEGVQSVVSLPGMAKTINAGWNEGSPRWRVLPQHPAALAQAISPIDTSTGLLNADGSVMPVHIFLEDHRSDTIRRVVSAVKAFRAEHPHPDIELRLASGNVGVMAATNEVVEAAQFPILLYVFAAVIGLCLLAFRSWRAAVCIVLPLALVAVLAYALMALWGIGLKHSTLPVVALGVGVGVDYGIYLFSRLQVHLARGELFEEALYNTLRKTGSAVVFTGLTLGIVVATWTFSELKFQADMGLLLTAMFLLNMAGAIFLLPAIARWMYPHHRPAFFQVKVGGTRSGKGKV